MLTHADLFCFFSPVCGRSSSQALTPTSHDVCVERTTYNICRNSAVQHTSVRLAHAHPNYFVTHINCTEGALIILWLHLIRLWSC